MLLKDYLKLILRKKQTLVSIFVAFFLITSLIIVAQPPRYGSSVKLLVVRVSGEKVDPYVVSRSNEQLSELLARMVHSYTFFEKVMDSDFNIKENYFSGSKTDQIKKWERAVNVTTLADTGLIEIETYHIGRNQAEQLARAVAYTLQTNHQLYHGYGTSVSLREIDTPITSNYPVKPDLVITLSLTVFLSLISFLVYIYTFPEEKYDIRIWPTKKATKKIKEQNDHNNFIHNDIAEDEDSDNDDNDSDPESYFHKSGDMNNVLR